MHNLKPHAAADWVLAAPFRSHLRWLIDSTGVPWRVIALQAAMPAHQIRHLLLGRGGRPVRRLHRNCAARILAVTPQQVQSLHTTIVPAAAAAARVRRLLSAGVGLEATAAFLGLTLDETRGLAAGRLRTCRRITELRATAACEARQLRYDCEPIDRPIAS